MEGRAFVTGAVAAAALARLASAAAPRYGLIGRIDARPGQREALAAILVEGTGAMPGCLLYAVAAGAAEPDRLWISEIRESKAAHCASLSLPQVRDAIGRARLPTAAMESHAETVPSGAAGLGR